MMLILFLLSLLIVQITSQVELQVENYATSVSNEDSSFGENSRSFEDYENITTKCTTRDQLGNVKKISCPTGHCEKEEQGLAVFTYQHMCANCLGSFKGWILYLFLATFPTTIFLLVVFGCGIKATSAPLNAIICICQVTIYICNLLANDNLYLFSYSRRPITMFLHFFGIWNLDFFGNIIPLFCINNRLKTLHILAMEYIVAIYPLACIVFVYVCIELHDRDNRLLKLMWKPFGKCLSMRCFKNYNPKMSIIEIFATFLILAYSKILFTSLNLMGFSTLVVNTKMENGTTLNTTATQVLLYDPSIPFLGSRHLPFFILAIVILFIFNILPLLFLLLYPTKLFQKALGCCTRIRWHPLHAFADAFQGCYKNGTNGTLDCRYFAGLYLLLRALFRIPAFFMMVSFCEFSIMFILISHTFGILFGVIRPYRDDIYNKWDSLAFFLMPLGQFWAVSQYFGKLTIPTEGILTLIMLVYMVTLATYKILSICAPRCLERCKQHCSTNKCCAYISSAPDTRQRENAVREGALADDNEDDNLFDRLDNRKPLQPETSGIKADAKEGTTAENRPITGCYYTYGSCN